MFMTDATSTFKTFHCRFEHLFFVKFFLSINYNYKDINAFILLAGFLSRNVDSEELVQKLKHLAFATIF